MGKKFEADNGRIFELSDSGHVSGTIEMDVNDIIDSDLEGALDMFAEKLVGNTLLSDVGYSVVGTKNGAILMQITGAVDLILERRADDFGFGP